MTTADFFNALAGGALIGLAAALLLVLNGRIAGVSGIINGAVEETGGERLWRALFVVGLVIGALIYSRIVPDDFVVRTELGWPVLAAAGLLVGVGTRMGSGCTSGHGVCGISRLSPRSIVATVTFMAFGFLSTYVVRHVIGLPA